MAASEPITLTLAVGPSLTPSVIDALAARVRRHGTGGPVRLVLCDVSSLAGQDIGTVDALARFALTVRRLGCDLQLQGASPDLRDLLGLAGLASVLPCPDGSVVEPRREAEEREELLGVEEERDPADPIA